VHFFQDREFTGGINISNWKVEFGNCSCSFAHPVDLPIGFLGTNKPGLCPRCFINDYPNLRTIRDRLDSLEKGEKELLFRNCIRGHLERQKTTTTRYQIALYRPRLLATNKMIRKQLFIGRFSWGNNPDPEAIRRLLYDDIPNAKEDLRRKNSDCEDVEIIPILICEKTPSRVNSAWKSMINAAEKWPRNPTKVIIIILDEHFQRKERLLRIRRSRK